MNKRSEHIEIKMMPDGNIRGFQGNTIDKRGVSELQITNPFNASPTIISATPPKFYYYEER